MVRESELGSSYHIITGSDEEFMDFCKEKSILGSAVYLRSTKQIQELKNGTTIYKGYGYLDSMALRNSLLRNRVLLGELKFKDWIS